MTSHVETEETARATPSKGQKRTGQKSSSERGSHTQSKKNPGKRPTQGGNSR